MDTKPKPETRPKYDPDFIYEGLPLFPRGNVNRQVDSTTYINTEVTSHQHNPKFKDIKDMMNN
jgi:hypothetical protein